MKIPTLDTFQVKPSSGGLPVVQGSSAEAFDPAYQQARQMARATSTAVDTYQQIAMKEQEHANETRLIDADNQARELALKLTFDKDIGYSNLKGGHVTNLPDGKSLTQTYGEKYQEGLDQISAGLANSAQRDAFHQTASQLRVQFDGRASAHEAQEYEVWNSSVYKGAAQNSRTDMALFPNDVKRFADNIDRIERATGAEAGRLGLSIGETNAMKDKEVSDAITLAIKTAYAGDDMVTANNLYLAYKDRVSPTDRLEIEPALKRGSEEKMAIDMVAKVGTADSNQDEGTTPPGQTIAYEFPLPGKGTTVPGGRYGAPRAGRPDGHLAEDYSGFKPGTPVKAGSDATVLESHFSSGGGNTVKLRFDDGSTHTFMHMDSLKVKKGDRIKQGTVLGGVGNTGSQSDGYHLHYEVEDKNGKRMPPSAYKPGPRLGAPGPAAAHPAGVQARAPTTYQDGLNSLMTQLDDHYGGHDKVPASAIKAVRAEYETQFQINKRAEAQSKTDGLNAAYTWLVNNPTKPFSAMPNTIKANIPPESYDQAMTFSQRVKAPPPRDETKDQRMYQWALDNPEHVRNLPTSKFFDIYHGSPYYDRLSIWRQELKTGKADGSVDALPHEAMNRIVTNRVASVLGMDPTPGNDATAAQHLASINSFVGTQVLIEQKRVGHQLKDRELQDFIDKLFLKQSHKVGTNNYRPRLATTLGDIEPAEVEFLKKRLKAKGVPQTDEMVLQAYYDWNPP